MKRLLAYVLILFMLAILVACSSLKQDADEKEDIEDMDNVFQFIASKYPEYTRDDFDKWTANFLDITGSGNEEIVFTTIYGDGNLDRVIVITNDQGEFAEIPSFIHLAKYENNLKLEDGFLVHETKSGGTGAFYYKMDLYIYDGFRLMNTLDSPILIEETVAAPMADYQIQGEIKGTLKDFVIEYTKTDNQTSREEIVAKDSYSLDEEGRFFWKKPLSISNTAKSFEQVYNGKNFMKTIEYFYTNLYHFDDNSREDFSIRLMNIIAQDKMELLPMGGLHFEYISDGVYNPETNELDISMVDEYLKDILIYINNSDVYQLVKMFYASDGEVTEGVFGVAIDYWTFQMLKPALDYVDPDRFTPFNYNYMEPILAPHFRFYSVEQVENTDIVYPNILVNSYEDIKKLEGAKTWKTTLLLPVEIIGN